MTSVKLVVDKGLCVGCGACFSICEENAIEMTPNKTYGIYCPVVDTQKCISCNKCICVCPGLGYNYNLNTEAKNNSIEIGTYINCYIGYTNLQDIKQCSASGGIASGLTTYLLEKKLIESALMSQMSKPMVAAAKIVNTRDGLKKSAGSLYCPVCTASGIKNLKDNFAMVGLPCHIQGLRNLEKMKRAKSEIAIGLFCGYGRSFLSTEIIIQQLKIAETDLHHIYYRSGEWPGNFEAVLNNGKVYKIPYKKAYSNLFAPYRCTLCSDATAEAADISCGDAWTITKFDKGANVIITRTEKGEELIKNASLDNYITIEKIDISSLLAGQKRVIRRKKSRILIHRKFYCFLFKKVPNDNVALLKPMLKDIFPTVLMYIMMYLARMKFLKKVFVVLLTMKDKFK